MKELGFVKKDKVKELEAENAELQAQIEKMRKLLDKWYSQHSDKGYTETFYQNLLRETESFLWIDVRR